MNSHRKIAIVVGVLFIVGTVAGMLSFGVTEALRAPGYPIGVSVDQPQTITGVLLVLVMGVALVPIPAILFPIFKEHSETLAVGYVVFRVLEFVTFFVSALGTLLLLTLSQEYAQAAAPDASLFGALGGLLQELEVWNNHIRLVIFSTSALVLNSLLYRSRLIPRWLSGWGLVGATLHLLEGLLGMYGWLSAISVLGTVLAAPIGLQEMVYAVWLIVKGFNSSAIVSRSANADVN